MSIQIPIPILTEYFLLLSYMSSLYILDISPVSDMIFKYFSPIFVGGLFISLMASFAVQKLFNFICSYLFVFYFVAFAFGV